MNKYSEERKQQQALGNIPEWLYKYCHDRFKYDENVKGLIIKKSGQFKGLVGMRPGHLRPDNRRIIDIDYTSYFEHHLVWLMFNGEIPNGQLDHVNCDPTDNRITNLRVATASQNGANRLLQSNSTTGYKGVSLRKDLKTKPYNAHLKYNGVAFNLGYFRTAIEAALEYDLFAREYFGEFAKLNFEDSYV